jgi:predicted NBD/HSP70 family sugar kinase
VGAGIVLGGKLFHGDNGGAGEIGHIRVLDDGVICRCGNRGCLETVASSRALIRRAQQISEDDPKSIIGQLAASNGTVDLEVILQGLQDGDLQVAAMIQESAETLGCAVANLVGALNINQVRIAGNLNRFGDELVNPIQRRVQENILEALALQTQVRTSTLGDDIVILGAASMILKNELGLL